MCVLIHVFFKIFPRPNWHLSSSSPGEMALELKSSVNLKRVAVVQRLFPLPLPSGETFSENFSHTERCQTCTICTGQFRMKAPCTDSNDATCVCNYGYYMNELSQRCEPCTRCPEGRGMLFSCASDHDSVCEECTGDTYSDQESSREPCMPCTTCDDAEVLQLCTSFTDTVCQGKTISSHVLIIVTCALSHSVPRYFKTRESILHMLLVVLHWVRLLSLMCGHPVQHHFTAICGPLNGA